MPNKLKRSNRCKDASYPRKDNPRPAEVIQIELSGSSCSNDDASPIADAGSPNNREVKPLRLQRVSFCAKGVKIAPVFLHAARRDGELAQPAEILQRPPPPAPCEGVRLMDSQQRLAATPHLTEKRLSRRGQFSPSALESCLEDIQTSNPTFPVRAVFSTLQEKTSLQDLRPFEPRNSLNQSLTQNHLTEKRKRGNESSEGVPKRLRSSLTTERTGDMDQCNISAQGVQESVDLTVKREPRNDKLSRTHRLRQQRGGPASEVNCEPDSERMNCTKSLKTPLNLQRDLSFEDALWTDRYSPRHSSEVIGNSASVTKLQCWLKKWKLRADCEERRQMKERREDENSSDSWDCGDFQGEPGTAGDGEQPLCNTMLITGPPGVGKTASVYACAQELGFKVFEVNCSSQRSGRHVLAQLKEATQSHLVELSGKDTLKPAYFNNYSSAPKSEALPGKTVPQKNVTSTSKKRAGHKFGRPSHKGKSNPSTVTLANYFKLKAKADHLLLGALSPTKKPDSNTVGSPAPACDQTVPQNKKTATSLILFEEVDVIFDEDVGFLAAIKTFMTTAKRPVVLTTNDPSFRERFNCSLEEIVFKTPSAVNVCSYLQLVALAENVRLELDDVGSLLRQARGDVRRCLLQLQLWVHSGGGRASQGEGLPTGSNDLSVAETGDSQLPPCDTGCTASMLGLHPVTRSKLLNLLKHQFWSETDMMKLLRLLTESWRGGVPLLYSNLQLLLPIEAKGTSFLDKPPCSGMQSEPAPPDHHIQQLDGNVSPTSSATSSRSVRSISRLSRKYAKTKPDTASSSSLTPDPQRTSLSSMSVHNRAIMWRDKAEQNASKAATDCLDPLTDFFDLMSYLDAMIPAADPLVSGSCRPEAFIWTGAEIKDGLLDEMSEETEVNSWSQERMLDIQAAVEGLGCHRCLWRVSDARTQGQKYRQEVGDTRQGRLTSPSKTKSLSLSFQPLCAPSVSQRRYKLSRTLLGSDYFSLLGNRRAVSVDYMPVLRYICHRAQRHKEEPVRCLNYLSHIHMGLSKSTIQLLAADFSEKRQEKGC